MVNANTVFIDDVAAGVGRHGAAQSYQMRDIAWIPMVPSSVNGLAC